MLCTLHTEHAVNVIWGITSELLWHVLVQLEAAKADREKVQGDISFRNTRREEVGFCANF